MPPAHARSPSTGPGRGVRTPLADEIIRIRNLQGNVGSTLLIRSVKAREILEFLAGFRRRLTGAGR